MNTAPVNDEVEISVFGPGYGECILIHIGCGEWIIVDSCINPKSKEPAALEYLKKIDVSLECVKMIIATHWHDDHIRGLFKSVKACVNAEFVLSEALCRNEFISLLGHFGTDPMMKSSSGVQELFNILTFLRSINKIPKRAVADRPLWLNKNKELNYNCGITSLSPSDYSIYLSNFKIAELVPQIKTEKRRLLSITPNHAAVVLWIRINDIVILLGSDLEVSTEEKSGWVAILNSKTRPDGKADFFKIPHHGSENSDHLRIWDEMVSDNAVVALTPFQNGKTSLPKSSDVERICSNRKECYITATERKKRIKTDRSVDKIIDRVGGIRSRKLVHSDFGQVRLRSVFSTRSFKWNIDLIGGASKLQFTANSR